MIGEDNYAEKLSIRQMRYLNTLEQQDFEIVNTSNKELNYILY